MANSDDAASKENIVEPKGAPSGSLEAAGMLPQSEDLYQSLFLAHPDGVALVVKGRIALINDRLAEMSGYATQEAIGMEPSELVVPEDKERLHDRITDLHEQEDVYPSTYTLLRKDGSRLLIDVHPSLIQRDGETVLVCVLRDISDQRKAEEALRESEEFLIRAQEVAHVGSWSMDMATQRVTWSEEMYRIFGLTEEEFDGSPESSTQSIHPDDLQKVTDAYESVFDRHELTPIEYRVLRPDGTERVVYAHGDFTFDDQGAPVRMVGTVQDITERKQAEEALRESEERYRTLYELASDAFLNVHPEGEILNANVSAAELLDYTLEEFKELSALDDVIAPEVFEETKAAWTKQLEERDYFLVETLWVRKDGTRVPVAVSGKALKIDGQPLLQLIGRDITERKQAEEALHESEAKWHLVAENSADYITLVSPDGTILYLNRTYAGTPLEEAIGTSVYEFLDEANAKVLREYVDRALAGDEPVTYEVDRIASDGSQRFYEGRIRALETRDGARMVIVSSTDVTERKQAEEALRALQEERYDRLLEVAPDGIVIVDGAGVIETVNARTEELFGYDRSEMIGRPVEMLIPERSHERHLAHRQAYTAAPSARLKGPELDISGLRKDGTSFPADISLNFMQTTTGIRIIAAVRDVTERVKAEMTLHESEARFSTAFHDNPVPVSISRIQDGKIIDVNDAFLSMTGYRRAETIGRTSVEAGMLIDPAVRDELAEAVREHGTVRDFPGQMKKNTGDVLDVLATMTQIELEGEPCLLTTIVDITEQKRLEEELQKTRDDLESKVERRMAGDNPYRLTFREFTVLHLIADGKADKEIAAELGISIYTVHRHVSNILAKMDSPSRTEAGTRALREGLLE